jgi:hypothetical protein
VHLPLEIDDFRTTRQPCIRFAATASHASMAGKITSRSTPLGCSTTCQKSVERFHGRVVILI